MEFDLSKIECSFRDRQRNITLPNWPSSELAEFVGILAGGGYINYYPGQCKYLLEIAGDSRYDNEYLSNHVQSLVKSLFNIEPSFFYRNDQNTMYLRLISKGIITFLMSIKFPSGRKGQISIPNWIKSNQTYFISFIKGLADTDCSIHYRKDYPTISFTSKSKNLIKPIFCFLRNEKFHLKNFYKEFKVDKRGYNDSITYRIKLSGHDNLKRWMSKIGFRNFRHLRKVGTPEFESGIKGNSRLN